MTKQNSKRAAKPPETGKQLAPASTGSKQITVDDQQARAARKAEWQRQAKDILDPSSMNGIVLGDLLTRDEDIAAHVLGALGDKITGVQQGDLSDLEGLLTAQAHVLNAIFVTNIMRAEANKDEFPPAHERYSRLAFKAQAQCRSTIEAVAEMKNPTVFTRNANVVNGHQQVNIGATRGRKSISVDQPLAAIASANGPALPGEDKARRGVPIARDA